MLGVSLVSSLSDYLVSLTPNMTEGTDAGRTCGVVWMDSVKIGRIERKGRASKDGQRSVLFKDAFSHLGTPEQTLRNRAACLRRLQAEVVKVRLK